MSRGSVMSDCSRSRVQGWVSLKERNATLATEYARYPHLSPRDFLAHVHGLQREKATLLFRLSTGHIQLRHHLHRIQAVESPLCDRCNDAPQTVAHLLLRCPSLASERFFYLESHGLDLLGLNYLFFASDALPYLSDFIRATNIFSGFLR